MGDREYYFAVYLNMLEYIVAQYKIAGTAERARLAQICDGQLDPSGRLLGRVRELSAPTPADVGALPRD